MFASLVSLILAFLKQLLNDNDYLYSLRVGCVGLMETDDSQPLEIVFCQPPLLSPVAVFLFLFISLYLYISLPPSLFSSRAIIERSCSHFR